ncbi:hypothetical protein [Terriglobus sp. RCC_193]|uniref:hypothetical protein n=1 Tax=Terriglobus sp. RCC_193 TaxID=3239218 RepID=UPI003525C7A5
MRLLQGILGLLFVLGGLASAQAPSVPAVPTTKVIAIGSVVSTAAGGAANIMPQEVSDTVRLYLSGKIDQWYVRKDQRGVVFLMNVTSTEEAHSLLEKLPLGVAGIMKFDLIPVGPLSPLNYLLPKEK